MIITGLETEFQYLTEGSNEKGRINSLGIQGLGVKLARYYQKREKTKEVKRVILGIEDAIIKMIDDVALIQTQNLLDNLSMIYSSFGLKRESDRILVKLRQLGPEAASELKPVRQSFKISEADVIKVVKYITQGDEQEILRKFGYQFIPRKEDVKNQIYEASMRNPSIFVIQRQIQDDSGRIIAKVGTLPEDFEGHLALQTSMNLSVSGIFLRKTIEELIHVKNISTRTVVEFLESCPVIETEGLAIIERALDAYFEDDYVVFIHLAIPQIEQACRNLLEKAGGNVMKTTRGGAYHLRTFDEILRDELVRNILQEDFVNYYRILFTDSRGWNLRNIVCHGIVSPFTFTKDSADRVLHALLCLGLIYEKDNVEAKPE